MYNIIYEKFKTKKKKKMSIILSKIKSEIPRGGEKLAKLAGSTGITKQQQTSSADDGRVRARVFKGVCVRARIVWTAASADNARANDRREENDRGRERTGTTRNLKYVCVTQHFFRSEKQTFFPTSSSPRLVRRNYSFWRRSHTPPRVLP